ncbi:MAG: flagellar basal body rod C-terminal domain-containing protein, partial [Methylococcales bacterium]
DGSVVLPADVGFDLAFSGTMATGDQFVIRPTFLAAKNISSEITDPRAIAASQTVNTLPGDNRIALELADLKTKSKLLGGTTTFSQSYEQLVADVGTKTHSASINRAAQEALFNQAKEARENGSGVNLDEEAANLIRFQNAYQAAAQAVSISRSIFDTLIGAVR